MSWLYMTESEAEGHGFTHHGRMFSVPIWVTDTDEPMVATKFAPLEVWLTICSFAVQVLGAMGVDASFPIEIGPRIGDAP